MDGFSILASVILIAIVVLAILFVFFAINRKKRGETAETDYRLFFIIGITWLPIGIATDNPALWGVGAACLVAGLLNRNKWKEEPKWSELNADARRTKLIIIGGLTALLLAGLAFYFLAK